MPSRMIGSGRETLPDVQKWSGGFPDEREVLSVFESGREALLNDREWSADPPG